jgi:ATP-binding cassette subfamily F protein 3
MRSKDILKEALKEFDGTAIIVSHDREFLDGLVDKLYEFGNQRVREHLGGIYEFLERKKIENLNELNTSSRPSLQTQIVSSPEKGQTEKWEIRKEQQRQMKRLEKTITDLERQIEKWEAEVKKAEQVLITPEGASNVNLLWEHAEIQKKITNSMEQWSEATAELENLKKEL